MEPVKEFNTTIRAIFEIFGGLSGQAVKSKLSIKYMRDKMNTGMATQPNYAIVVLGPYFWNRKAEIFGDDAEHFLQRNYGPTVQALSQKHDFNFLDAMNTIAYMKEAYKAAPKSAQAQIKDLTKTLVSSYAEYVKSCRLTAK
jgi:hypothetical protein